MADRRPTRGINNRVRVPVRLSDRDQVPSELAHLMESGDFSPETIQRMAELLGQMDLQRLLLNELNHRVKNTLATIQALAAQTFRNARDLPSAREALEHRIHSMAQAHDLLTMQAGKGANLNDVVMRALDVFTPSQVSMTGAAIDVSPKHVLALSLALHELATNAVKYGALSWPEGRVSVQWGVQEGLLHLHWEESGGPPVGAPTKKGFGSRLLEDLLARDLDGHTTLSYDAAGLCCRVIARL